MVFSMKRNTKAKSKSLLSLRVYIYVYTTEKQVISRTVITNVTLVFCARQLLVFSVSRSNSIPIIRTDYVSAIYFPHFSFVSAK